MPRNGNGHEGRNGGREAVPRWVRTLFGHHEAHMTQMERKREEDKAEHEERMSEMKAEHEQRMDRMDRQIALQEKRLARLEDDRRTFVAEISRIDAEGKEERKRAEQRNSAFLAALQEIRGSLHGLNVRMSRLEGK